VRLLFWGHHQKRAPVDDGWTYRPPLIIQRSSDRLLPWCGMCAVHPALVGGEAYVCRRWDQRRDGWRKVRTERRKQRAVQGIFIRRITGHLACARLWSGCSNWHFCLGFYLLFYLITFGSLFMNWSILFNGARRHCFWWINREQRKEKNEWGWLQRTQSLIALMVQSERVHYSGKCDQIVQGECDESSLYLKGSLDFWVA
jgi:hypothetical protein